MNEKLQYATMLEIPVNTCNVTLKEEKKRKSGKRKTKNHDAVKEELMNKINSEEQSLNSNLALPAVDANGELGDESASVIDGLSYDNDAENSTNTAEKEKPKGKFKFSVITAQFAIIGVLIATIFLTNAFYADSGINVFFKSVFGSNQVETVVDTRTHQEFAPVVSVGEMSNVVVDGGVMTFSGEGSVYSPCDGKITSVSRDGNGKYIFEITHSENFKSVISGLDYAYAGLDDTVYANIPVGYVNTDGATMCFKGGDGLVIADYQLVDGSVVWAV